MANLTLPQLVDENVIAGTIGMSVAWVRLDRRTARRLPFYRIGRAIRYDPQECLAVARGWRVQASDAA